jgi:hypothetical protein
MHDRNWWAPPSFAPSGVSLEIHDPVSTPAEELDNWNQPNIVPRKSPPL